MGEKKNPGRPKKADEEKAQFCPISISKRLFVVIQAQSKRTKIPMARIVTNLLEPHFADELGIEKMPFSDDWKPLPKQTPRTIDPDEDLSFVDPPPPKSWAELHPLPPPPAGFSLTPLQTDWPKPYPDPQTEEPF